MLSLQSMKLLPFIQKHLELTMHIISWFLIFTLPIMLTEWGSSIDWVQYLRHSIVSLCCCIIFYVNYLYFIPHFLFKNEGGRFLLLNVLCIIMTALTIHFSHELFREAPHRQFVPEVFHIPPPPHQWIFGGLHLVMLMFAVGLSTALRVSIRWIHTERKLAQAEQEKSEAELKNLKNQLNPHFLLNTLNNIYALIAFDGKGAQEAVQELSKMLRYMLYENQSAPISLKKELEFIDNYISLMRIRLPKSVEVRVHLDAGKKPLEISPLIFISLIENVFKHGISPTEPSFISISICGHSDGRIVCETMNSNFPKNEADKSGSGIGLTQVHKRLELLYPDRYEWDKRTNDDGKTYISTLTIQTPDL